MEDFMIGCFAAILMVLLLPLLAFGGGYLTGLILKWIIGDAVVNGMNLLLNTTRFTPDMLPVVCGALGTIGSFFKSSVSTSK